MRIVLDTNVFISGIYWRGNFCYQILEAWRFRKFTLISSLPIIEELIKTMGAFKISTDSEIINDWKEMILENAVIVKPDEKLDLVKTHPDDNKFFEAAVAGDVQFIISQDHHLLRVCDFQGIRVISPEEFCGLILGN